MSPHPIDGARAKLDRAEELIDQLDSEITAFLHSNPLPYEIVGEHQNEGREYAYVVKKVPVVPLRFAVIVGDVVHNLRSSLDHIVYALVINNGEIPTNQTQFPICTTRGKYQDALSRGRIKGVNKEAAELIEAAQPFNSPTPDDTFLAALDELSVIDKHRLPIVIASAATLGHNVVFENLPGYSGPNANVTVTRFPDHRTQPWAVSKVGDVLFSMGFEEPALHMRANIEFFVEVAFEKVGRVSLQPITKILRLIQNTSKNALPVWQRIFK